MKIDKLSLDGKKDSIEVLDKIFSGKINKKLVSNALYKANANYKGRRAKTKQKNEIIGSTSKICSKRNWWLLDMQVEKLLYLLVVVWLMVPKGQSNYKKRKINKSEKKLSIASLISQKKNLIILLL